MMLVMMMMICLSECKGPTLLHMMICLKLSTGDVKTTCLRLFMLANSGQKAEEKMSKEISEKRVVMHCSVLYFSDYCRSSRNM